MATQADITAADGFFRAEDKDIVFTVRQQDTVTPQNITGWTLTFRVAQSQYGAAIITKVPVMTTPVSGVCTVTLSSSDTSSLANEGADTTYFYDLRRTDSGSRTELAFGSLVVRDTNTNG